MSSASTENGSLWTEIRESTRSIFKANCGHFHTLSILFLLPIFFSLVVYPSFHLALFHPDYHFTTFTQFPQSHLFLSKFEIVVPIVYTLFVVLLFLCAVATITYSALHASYGRPINLVSSIKSIRKSFFPLLSTFIVSHAIFISITLVFTLVLTILVQIVQALGLIEIKYESDHFLFLAIPALIVLVPVLIWLQVNWSLAYVIAIVESKWGFETLRRSSYLVKGKISVALSMMLLYGLLMGIMVVSGAMYLVTMGAAKGNHWRSSGVILQTALVSVMGYLMMGQFLVGNVVLYMRCNDLNGEKSPLKNCGLWTEIVESNRSIFKANSGHFHALSILFLLPISFSLVVYPSFHLALFHPDYDFISFAQPHLFLSNFEIIVPIVYTLFLVLPFLCAVATTTYSAVHASYGRPINLIPSIKSIRKSFFPLLSTLVVSHSIIISITLVFTLVLTIIVQILQALGLIEIKYDDSDHFLFLAIPAVVVLVPVLLWLHVNWSLAYVIAVIESKWGYETLNKSSYLMKGQRWVAFGIYLYYGLSMGIMMVCGSMFFVITGVAKGNQWRSLDVILLTAMVSVIGYLMMNQYLVANVVLYMKCKDLSGEKLHSETGGGYVSLPLDEKNQAIE